MRKESYLEIWQYHVSSLRKSDMDDVVSRVSDLNMQVPALGAYPQFHLSGKEAKVVQARRQVGMIRAEGFLIDRQGTLIERLRSCVLTLVMI